MAAQSPICDFGWKAVDFRLPGTDGKTWSLADVRGPNGTLVMFICNHCPYVKAVIDRVVATWEQTGGNVAETARRLGITRNTVYKKLRLR
mgnify:CR=1 FL=1